MISNLPVLLLVIKSATSWVSQYIVNLAAEVPAAVLKASFPTVIKDFGTVISASRFLK